MTTPPPSTQRNPHMTRTRPSKTQPTLTQEERNQAATAWLTRCGQTPTPERIDDLAPHVDVYPPGSPKLAIADRLVKQGRTPTPEAVREHARHDLRWLTRRPKNIPDKDFKEAILWISAYHAEHGQGPLWREVRDHMKWSTSTTRHALHWLRATHQVEFNRTERSLRPALAAPAADPSEAQQLREQKHSTSPHASYDDDAAHPSSPEDALFTAAGGQEA